MNISNQRAKTDTIILGPILATQNLLPFEPRWKFMSYPQ